MFLDNKYTNWYYYLINKAKSQNRKRYKKPDSRWIYYEQHHIIPKCFNGPDIAGNLVLLTAREHFVIHWLLTKMVNNTRQKEQMLNAAAVILVAAGITLAGIGGAVLKKRVSQYYKELKSEMESEMVAEQKKAFTKITQQLKEAKEYRTIWFKQVQKFWRREIGSLDYEVRDEKYESVPDSEIKYWKTQVAMIFSPTLLKNIEDYLKELENRKILSGIQGWDIRSAIPKKLIKEGY